jgi:hypothetical protein
LTQVLHCSQWRQTGKWSYLTEHTYPNCVSFLLSSANYCETYG